MTIKECIDVVDNLKPNQYSIEDKVAWLSFLDMTIINEVLKTHEGYDGRYDDFTGYSPDILTAGLIIPSPYDRVYTAYLKMKIDEENGETARYNNSVTLYNTYLMEYKKWYNANHMPLSPSDRRTMPQSKPSTLDVSEAQLEQLRKLLYAELHDEMLGELSDDNIHAIVKTYMDNNAQMLKGKDGQDGVNGKDGLDGIDGKDGVNGVGIQKVWIDDAGELHVTLTSGTTKNLGMVKGDKGDQGIQGIQGVKGDKGDQGDQGKQGIQGDKGDKGERGDDGEITLEYANSNYASAIREQAEGVSVGITSTNARLSHIKLMGMTTQETTPSIDNESVLNHIGANGSVSGKVIAKNFLKVTISTFTNKGITFTVNEDKSITVNGTSTGDMYVPIGTANLSKDDKYIISGCPSVGKNGYIYGLYYNYQPSEGSNWDYGDGSTFRPSESGEKGCNINIKNGVTVSNLTFYPMIRRADVSDATYEPYTEQPFTYQTPDGVKGIPLGQNIPDAIKTSPIHMSGVYHDGNQYWIGDTMNEDGKDVQRIGYFTADSNFVYEDLSYYTGALQTVANYRYNFTNSSSIQHTRVMSNKLSFGYTWEQDRECTYVTEKKGIDFSIKYERLGITKEASKTERLNAIKTWLSNNVLTFAYVLAEPVVTNSEQDGVEDIVLYQPYTNIVNDAKAYMEAEYVVDTKTYIEKLLRKQGSQSRIGEVTLLASAWTGSGYLYSQVVKIVGVTAYSQVDLTPSVEQLAIFYEKDLAFVTENDSGVVTVYAIGQKPQNDYTMQVTITEVDYE